MNFLRWPFLLAIGTALLVACGGGPSTATPAPVVSILDGATRFTGTVPPLVELTYTTREGDTLTIEGYPGFISLFVDPDTSKSVVEEGLKALDAEIVGAVPLAGLYLVQVTPGQEPALRSALYSESWVLESSPASPVGRADMAAMDFHTMDSSRGSLCGQRHGGIVKEVMQRSGGTVAEIDVDPPGTENDLRFTSDLALRLLEEMERAFEANKRLVINISLQSSASAKAGSKDRSGCSDATCRAIRHQQFLFFKGILQALEATVLKRPGVADSALIALSSGNAGVDLDSTVRDLRDVSPNAIQRVKLVGGSDASGKVHRKFNHLTSTTDKIMVYARGVDVQVAGIRCNGTSFASPEVARVLDLIWSQNLELTSVQLLTAFDQLVDSLGTGRVLPQDENGFTPLAFINQGVPRVEGDSRAPTPDFQLSHQWAVNSLGEHGYFSGIALDSVGDVYIADDGGIQRFDPSGSLITSWEASFPYAIAVNPASGYVFTERFDTMLVHDREGNPITEWIIPRLPDDRSMVIFGIAVDIDGNVYALDHFGNRVLKFAPDGAFLMEFCIIECVFEELISPNGLAVDGEGNIFVVASRAEGNQVFKFAPDGSAITSWGGSGEAPGEFHLAHDVALDNAGTVYVSESISGRVQLFTSDGVYVAELESTGTSVGEISFRTIAVDASGNVYVLDREAAQVQVFSPAKPLVLSPPRIPPATSATGATPTPLPGSPTAVPSATATPSRTPTAVPTATPRAPTPTPTFAPLSATPVLNATPIPATSSHVFRGTASVDGVSAAGLLVTAWIDEEQVDWAPVGNSGSFLLVLSQPQGGPFTGKVVTFKVDGLFADTVFWQTGGFDYLDLAAFNLTQPAGGRNYLVVVEQPAGESLAGKRVTFQVGNYEAGQTGTWQQSRVQVLNLAASRANQVDIPNFAFQPPSDNTLRPQIFVGTATIDGQPAPDGTVVIAWVDGEPVAQGTVSSKTPLSASESAPQDWNECRIELTHAPAVSHGCFPI